MTAGPPAAVAVVGHVEVVDFAPVPRLPGPGEIVHAEGPFRLPAGGGAVAAVVLAELAGACTLLCALGDDAEAALTRSVLAARGVEVRAAVRDAPTRRAFTHLDLAAGERTITVLGERLAPRGDDAGLGWEDLAAYAAVYVTAGDADALTRCRAAGVVVATPRTGDGLRGGAIDVLVGSAGDPSEILDPEALGVSCGAVVATAGAQGGTWTTAGGRSGGWDPAPLPGPVQDAYGCGDAFAAALAFGLGRGLGLAEACDAAAVVGAGRLVMRGPY